MPSFEEKLARQRQIAHATGTSPMSQLRNPPPPPAAPKPSPLAKKKKVSPPRRGPPTTKTRIQQMEQSNAAQRVQAIHRGRQTRTELQNKQVAAQRVQAIHRGRSQRLELKEQKQAATRVQAIRRGTSQRKIYLAGGASRVVVCGSAWSGRTVAAAALATKLAVPLVSVGELLRRHAASLGAGDLSFDDGGDDESGVDDELRGGGAGGAPPESGRPLVSPQYDASGRDWVVNGATAERVAARRQRRLTAALSARRLAPDEVLIPLLQAELARCGGGWVLEGGPRTDAQCRALQALPAPPTHWVLCSLDDGAAEVRIAREADGVDALRRCRNRFASWKREMLEVFSEQPSFLRIDASNDGASADPRAINQLLSHILKPSAAEHDGPPPGAATRTAPRRGSGALQSSDLHGRRGSRGGAAAEAEAAAAASAAHREQAAEAALEARLIAAARGELGANLLGASPTVGARQVIVDGEIITVGGPAPPPAAADTFSGGVAGPARRSPPRPPPVDVEISAMPAAAAWRQQPLLQRAAKYTSSFVRAQLPLEGVLLLSLDGLTLSRAVCASWTQAVRLCVSATVVDADGHPIVEAGEVRTAAQLCEPGQSDLAWREELSLRLPRKVMATEGAALRLGVLELASSTLLLHETATLDELTRTTTAATAEDHAMADADWLLRPLGALSQLQAVGGPPPSPLFSPPAGGCRLRVKTLLLDWVGLFGQLLRNQHAALAGEEMLSNELSECEEEAAAFFLALRQETAARQSAEGRVRALEKEVKDLKAETDRLNTESERKAIALGKTDGALKDAKAEEARLRKSLKEKDAEVGQLKKTRDAIPVHLQAVFSSPPSAEPPKLASNAVKELARGTPKKTVGPPQRRKGPKPQVEGFDAILADIETAFKRFDVDGNGRISVRELKVTLKELGVDSSTDTCKAHMKRFDGGGNQTLELDEFEELVKFLHKKKLAEDAKKGKQGGDAPRRALSAPPGGRPPPRRPLAGRAPAAGTGVRGPPTASPPTARARANQLIREADRLITPDKTKGRPNPRAAAPASRGRPRAR